MPDEHDTKKERTGICLGWCGKVTEGFYCRACQRKKQKAEHRFGTARDAVHIPRRKQEAALLYEKSAYAN